MLFRLNRVPVRLNQVLVWLTRELFRLIGELIRLTRVLFSITWYNMSSAVSHGLKQCQEMISFKRNIVHARRFSRFVKQMFGGIK